MGTRRGRPDPLERTGEPRWLVVRDRVSRALEFRALAGGSDLRGALTAKQVELVTKGWRAGVIPKKCSFFFADRDNERVCVSVECFEPASQADQGFRR